MGRHGENKKIVDTAISFASGEIFSLGFNRIAHETAVTINHVTKSHVQELANLNTTAEIENETSPELYVRTSLEKLAFTMSDCASNEKKADRLLDMWRDEVIGQCDENEHPKVLHFHCMAHVLLGFHSYLCKDMVDHEKKLKEQHGP